jgi:tellurite resistance protein TerC
MDTIGQWWMWAAFAVFVVIAVLVDLVALRQQGAHRVAFREALNWSLIWVALAFVFCGLLWWYIDLTDGRELANLKAGEFLTGYLIEKSLSVDNIFVFLMLFSYFGVPAEFQKRVIVLGVIGAIVLRAIMIFLGAVLIARFHWILYLFGAFLVVTGVKIWLYADKQADLEANPVLRWMRGHLRITREFHGENFWLRQNGAVWFTPLFVVTVLVGVTDIIFAVDSIPAIFAITDDPFIVLTSNVFAVLGLRALFFLLADMKDRFHLLSYGLAIVLVFIGAKMLLLDLYKVPVFWALGVVLAVLVISILASLALPSGGKGGDKPAHTV